MYLFFILFLNVGTPFKCILSIFVSSDICPNISNMLGIQQTELSTISNFIWFPSVLSRWTSHLLHPLRELGPALMIQINQLSNASTSVLWTSVSAPYSNENRECHAHLLSCANFQELTIHNATSRGGLKQLKQFLISLCLGRCGLDVAHRIATREVCGSNLGSTFFSRPRPRKIANFQAKWLAFSTSPKE